MQISHESIYTFIYMMPRGDLRKELIASLRQKKKNETREGCPLSAGVRSRHGEHRRASLITFSIGLYLGIGKET